MTGNKLSDKQFKKVIEDIRVNPIMVSMFENEEDKSFEITFKELRRLCNKVYLLK